MSQELKKKQQHFNTSLSGSSGTVVYSDLPPGRYTLRIAAINYKKEDRAIVRRRFEVPPTEKVCLLHLVNDGIVVGTEGNSGNVTVNFDGVGPVQSFLCALDGAEPVTCKELVAMCPLHTAVRHGHAHLSQPG